MRQSVAAIRTIGRATQGVKLVKLDGGTSISAITRVIGEDVDTQESENQTIDVFEGKKDSKDV
jgi:DNA gyrase subunit A